MRVNDKVWRNCAGVALGIVLAGPVLWTGVAVAQSRAPSRAQSAVSRPVVQALPNPNNVKLNAALARLARDPRDVTALLDAGDAARSLGDFDAAIGFYRRADEASPGNARIKAGLGSAFVMTGDPVSAIPYFTQAEQAGALPSLIAADRGLAYDLVGDNDAAKRYYQAALAGTTGPGLDRALDTVRMRLAVNQAITGDMTGAQATLMPLLSKQDKPGWRTRAFTLAIAGQTEEAVTTAQRILPGQLAQSIAPYLRYMPRLTRAQQAAAANLGRFPRASEIGRDDPRIAAYAPPTQLAAGTSLIPKGAPLDSGKPGKAKPTRSSSRTRVAKAEPVQTARPAATSPARGTALAASDPDRVAPPEPRPGIETSDSAGELPAIATSAPPVLATRTTPPASTPSLTPTPAPARTLAPTPTPTPGLASTPARVAAGTLAPATALTPRQAVPVRTAEAAPGFATPGLATATASASPSAPRPGFDLSSLPTSQPVTAPPPQAAPATTTLATTAVARPASSPSITLPAIGTPASASLAATPTPTPASRPAPRSLSEVFADLGVPTTEAAPVAGAVDIRTLAVAPPPAKAVVSPAAKALAARDEKAKADAKAKEEAKAKAKKPAPPTHPSRIWVQIGVGRDKAAIAFDWRRYAKQAPAQFKGRTAWVSDMGRTNRILAGPFETMKAANAFAADLRKAGFDGVLPWTSPAGQVVDPLAGSAPAADAGDDTADDVPATKSGTRRNAASRGTASKKSGAKATSAKAEASKAPARKPRKR